MSTTGTEGFVRLTLLTFEGGIWIGKKILLRELDRTPGSPTLDTLLHNKKSQLTEKKKHKDITSRQYKTLFPTGGVDTDVEEWDLSLIIKIIKFLFDTLPDQKTLPDQDRENLNEILRIRNEVICHASHPSLKDQEFHTHWNNLTTRVCDLASAVDENTKQYASDLVQRLSGGPLDLQSSIEKVVELCRNDELMENMLESLATLQRRLNEVASGVVEVASGVVDANKKLDDVRASLQELKSQLMQGTGNEGQCMGANMLSATCSIQVGETIKETKLTQTETIPQPPQETSSSPTVSQQGKQIGKSIETIAVLSKGKLSKLWFGNFIHFKNQEYFEVNEGLNILLGPNHTGKTSVVEAIRSCISVKLNGTLSKPHDAKKISYVISKFKSESTGESAYSVIWVSMVRIQVDVDGTNKLVTLKLVHINNDQGEEKNAIDIVDDKDLVNKQLTSDQFDFTVLSAVEALREDGHGEKILKEAVKQYEEKLEYTVKQYLEHAEVKVQLHNFFKPNEAETNDTSSETILQNHIDAEIVAVPFHSFAARQWTRSKCDMEHVEKAGLNCDEISLKKEIICWYLSKENSNKTKRIEEKYFDILSDHSLFKFHLVDGHVQVYDGDDPNRGTILEVPEKIYEAKSAAIVLADPEFKTICLYHAERDMHLQMIESFRDLVLQDIDDKVVLVITHHPTFLAPWNISNTSLFQKRADSNRYQCSVKPLKYVANQIGERGCQIITRKQFQSVFFAERICWVEGMSEYRFMTALKYVLVNKNSQVLKKYCGKDEEQMKRFYDFLVTLQIVNLEHFAHMRLFREISQALDLPHYFILDFDSLKLNLRWNRDSNTPGNICESFCDTFGVQMDKNRIKCIKTTNDIVDSLQAHGIFVWKLANENDHSSGTIGHAVKRLTDNNHKLYLFLEERKMEIRVGRHRRPIRMLFRDQKIKDKDIADVVEHLLDPENDSTAANKASGYNDFNRLVKFLMERCDNECLKSSDKERLSTTEGSERKRKRTDDIEIIYQRKKRKL